ncbi:MAG: glycosyltransferase, partial [Pirellulaceae bacterium]
PDIVHVNTDWGCGWDGLLAARYLGLPVVGTFHTFFADPGYLKTFGLPQHWLFEKLIWNYSRFFYDRCDVTTAPSHAVRDALVANGAATVPQVMSNGIPDLLDRSDTDVSALRKQHGLEGPTFVYVGRISPEKSVEVVLAAFRYVVRRFPEARFLMVGDGPERAPLTRLMQRMGIENHVVQLGHVPHEQLIAQSIPRWGDVFVTASKTENQPISILEALSFGVPVIGARSKGIPELIEEDVNGMLFEPDNEVDLAEKMMALAGDLPRCRRLGEGARQAIQKHTITHTVDRLLSVYEQAIRQRGQLDSVTQQAEPVADNPGFGERAWRARTPE